jgi:hypothetical protein
MQSGFNALRADNLHALLPEGLDLGVEPSGPPMEKDMFCISPPPSLLAQHESVHSLIRGMSSSVTFLMNTMELHRHHGGYHLRDGTALDFIN